MLKRKLGKTGWMVGVIGFGAWGVGGQWGEVERKTAVDTIRAAREAGVNFFDTADAYGEPQGLSEVLIGEALQSERDKVIIATKVGNWARRFGQPLPYTHPLHIIGCCDASLYRLKTDYIDLYQCHLGNLDHHEVFLEAFDLLLKQGKIRAFGVSTHSVEVSQTYTRDGRLAAVQLDYSILNRAPERDLLLYCAEHQIGTIIRGPLAMGGLEPGLDSCWKANAPIPATAMASRTVRPALRPVGKKRGPGEAGWRSTATVSCTAPGLGAATSICSVLGARGLENPGTSTPLAARLMSEGMRVLLA